MLASFLLFGGLWFWLTSAAAAIILLVFIENEKPVCSTFTFLAFLAFVTVFSNVNPFTWAAEHFVLFLEYLAAYLAVGVGWSVAKWVFFFLNRRDQYEVLRAEYLKRKKLEAVRNSDDFKTWLWNNDTYHVGKRGEFPPLPQSNKSRIILWMAYWPWSATWTLINDPLKRFWRLAYQSIAGLMADLSKAAFAKYRSDLES